MNKKDLCPELSSSSHSYPGPERRNQLGSRRQADLTPLLTSLGRVQTHHDFIAWCRNELVGHLPHGALICCLGRVEGKIAKPIETLSHEFPAEFAHADLNVPGNFRASIMSQWLNSGEPILANHEEVEHIISDPSGLANFTASGLQNIAAHGMHDFTRVYLSHFCFHRIPIRLNEKHRQLMELMVPPMHAALLRVVHVASIETAPPAGNRGRLTPRELEILGWIGAGKTNDEISTILGTRYKTVKNQVQSILVKLRVNNRAQAVAMAARVGLPLVANAKQQSMD